MTDLILISTSIVEAMADSGLDRYRLFPIFIAVIIYTTLVVVRVTMGTENSTYIHTVKEWHKGVVDNEVDRVSKYTVEGFTYIFLLSIISVVREFPATASEAKLT
jgi:hypothetical protein